VRHWNLSEVDTAEGTRSPVVLHSTDGVRRIVVIGLGAGERLGDHQVKESALVLVLDGSARVEAGGDAVDAGPGDLFEFDPGEQHAVTSDEGVRLLLLLAPWPGDGHYRGERDFASRVSAS
jgi:quercetin dioxygenase-like cupin family protein